MKNYYNGKWIRLSRGGKPEQEKEKGLQNKEKLSEL